MATHALPLQDRSRRRPALGARLVAWWRGASFDAALAAGADPAGDPRLAAHAARLAQAHRRRVLAEAIECALEDALRPRRGFSAAVPVRGEALEAHDELLSLAALLRTAPVPPPRALALSRRLLLDGCSPLFNPEAAGTLRGAVHEALLAFDADRETYPPEV